MIAERIFKLDNQAEAIRVKNYSYEALEEFISNAIYHKSYQIYEPITIRIEKEQIEITSIPGPDRSISDQDIANYQMRTRRYRNRRIGDFLKELHLVEGRNTGIPTAIKGIRDNGSPMPKLLTDEDRSFFSVVIPIHEKFRENQNNNTANKKERRTKAEIKNLILDTLDGQNLSASSLYRMLGNSGNMSKTFRQCIEELIQEAKIKALEEHSNSSSNLLTKI